jgi:hypothetical protein
MGWSDGLPEIFDLLNIYINENSLIFTIPFILHLTPHWQTLWCHIFSLQQPPSHSLQPCLSNLAQSTFKFERGWYDGLPEIFALLNIFMNKNSLILAFYFTLDFTQANFMVCENDSAEPNLSNVKQSSRRTKG